MNCRSLAACRIFYLEDDFFIAEETRENLEHAGGFVVVCGSVPRAFEVLEQGRFDAALLDINIAGSTSVPVARQLKRAGVPVLFVSAYDRDILPTDLATCGLIRKPVTPDVVIREMVALLRSQAQNDDGTNSASRP
ncbi:MAG: response regulator [Erythrobacter sp.]